MPLALNYEAFRSGQSSGERPGLVPAIISLAMANLNIPFLWAWAYLQLPPFSAGGLSMPGDLFAVVVLAGWPALSIVLALAGLLRCFRHARRLAALLMSSFALTLDGIFALILLKTLLP